MRIADWQDLGIRCNAEDAISVSLAMRGDQSGHLRSVAISVNIPASGVSIEDVSSREQVAAEIAMRSDAAVDDANSDASALRHLVCGGHLKRLEVPLPVSD
ncbi:hypothetical protein Acsp02_28980 [Actinoplanes sp. NBRC 103695]|nr:hypothetical protein Acsp02_28980 [Actinoplanes sp. NBRC 103695]